MSHETDETEERNTEDSSSISKKAKVETCDVAKGSKRDERDNCEEVEFCGQKSLGKRLKHQPHDNLRLTRIESHSNLHTASCEQPLDSPQPHLHVQYYGLPQNTAALFNKLTTCVLLAHKELLLNSLVDDAVSFKGGNKLDEQDLQGLHGCKPSDKDKFLTNFVIEAYFDLIATRSASKAVQVESGVGDL